MLRVYLLIELCLSYLCKQNDSSEIDYIVKSIRCVQVLIFNETQAKIV